MTGFLSIGFGWIEGDFKSCQSNQSFKSCSDNLLKPAKGQFSF